MTEKPRSRVAILALLLSVAAGFAAIAAGFGVRWELWDYRAGFTVLRWAAWSGLGVAVLALLAAVLARPQGPKRGFAVALVALAVGLVTFAVPYQAQQKARSVPRIHDITTDTKNPPQFRAVLPLRAGARNPASYAGAEAVAQQKKGYPDIAPLVVSRAPAEAYRAALSAARELGWNIVAAVPDEGRIEATDRTFWFGFTDDIVVRIAGTDNAGESLIDVRSKSRVGRSDAGTNARRIRAFSDAVKAAAATGH